MALPGAVWTVPAAQPPAAMQSDWLRPEVKVPSAQTEHWRSDTVVPSMLTKAPGWQAFQTAQDAAFATLLKVPLPQGAHTRSVIFEPAAATCWPAAQIVWATQAVAGFAS